MVALVIRAVRVPQAQPVRQAVFFISADWWDTTPAQLPALPCREQLPAREEQAEPEATEATEEPARDLRPVEQAEPEATVEQAPLSTPED